MNLEPRKTHRKIVRMIEGIYEAAGLEHEYFTEVDLKDLARAVVSAYVARIGQMITSGKRVELSMAKFAFDVMNATKPAAERALTGGSDFGTDDLLRIIDAQSGVTNRVSRN